MLVEFKVENYLSIKDEIVLSMECSSSTSKLANNFFKEGKFELLKSVAIYGANATGKSNLLKAINFLKLMVIGSQNHKFGDLLNVIPYRLDSKSMSKPSKFEISFILNTAKYTYGFSCTKEKIIEEYLLSSSGKAGRPKVIFRRENTKDFVFNPDTAKERRIKEDTNDNQLYLSKTAVSNYEELREVYTFLSEGLIVGINESWGSYTITRDTITRISQDPVFKNWAIAIMKKADFGGIVDLSTEVKERVANKFEFEIGESPSIKNSSNVKEEYIEIGFIHKNTENENIIFGISDESTGTLNTFGMLGPIYDILENGKVVVIDEFENNLHPEITRFLVKLFHSKHNKKNGQIIFSTHDTSLLRGNDLFRRDQIYLTEKDPNKNTRLNSFMDYKLREDIDFQNAYLNGRVGGLPFVDESYV